ncbi:hypothetical protein K435DRAFT_841896 [Dendrothele bispora CBS 962.96]|uniref:DUF6534 domain-containing protein n=1 Tax=Dendrothele bispora (strain CBS 962.96) TaxID=1314807 RepID=A0A4S8LKR9_DENBC|nr:hypothetical protein K435DRAFT_841896 [Dendrothele bispora CBS 962.96]
MPLFWFVSYLLEGIVIVQAYIYYMSFPNDKVWMKTTVYTLFVLDIARLSHGWGRPEHLHETEWGFAFIPMLCALCTTVVQIFFAWRIHVLASRLSQKKIFWPVIVLIVCISFAQLIGATVSGSRWIHINVNGIFLFHKLFGAISVWLVGSAAGDVLIATSMIYLLSTARRKTKEFAHDERTNHLIAGLIRNSVETGAITAGAALLDVIFFLTMNSTTLHFAFSVSLSKLYTNSLYATLNSRAFFKRDLKKESTMRSTADSHVRSLGGQNPQSSKATPERSYTSSHYQISFTREVVTSHEPDNWQGQWHAEYDTYGSSSVIRRHDGQGWTHQLQHQRCEAAETCYMSERLRVLCGDIAAPLNRIHLFSTSAEALKLESQ